MKHGSAEPGVGRRAFGFRFEARGGRIRIDLLRAEGQGTARWITEHDFLHAEHAPVEIDGGVDVGDRQHPVVELANPYAHQNERGMPSRCSAT